MKLSPYFYVSIKKETINKLKFAIMRAITEITIRVEKNWTTCFFTYNNDSNDYSFNNHKSLESAVNSIPKNDPFFPVQIDSYRLLKVNGNKTISDENIKI